MSFAQRLRAYPGIFLLAVLTGFILAGNSLGSVPWGRAGVDLVSLAWVLLATRAFLGTAPPFRILAILGLVALVLRIAGWMVPGRELDVAVGIAITLFLGGFLLIVLRSVLGPGVITHDRIMAAVAGYVLLGICWAFLHSAVAVAMPGAFRTVVDAQEANGSLLATAPGFPSLYYSFSTLMTMGAGTTVPVTHLAQTMAWIEAGMGQIYLTVLVARLVSLHVAAQRP
jgi:Ion channel